MSKGEREGGGLASRARLHSAKACSSLRSVLDAQNIPDIVPKVIPGTRYGFCGGLHNCFQTAKNARRSRKLGSGLTLTLG